MCIRDSGERVHLRIQRGGLAQLIEFPHAVVGAQNHVEAQPPAGRVDGAGDQVVNHAFGEPVSPFGSHGIRNQDNGEAVAACRGAHCRQKLLHTCLLYTSRCV